MSTRIRIGDAAAFHRVTIEAVALVVEPPGLRENAARFESRLVQAHAARPVRLTHAYFGKLTAPQILKLLAVHAAHHRDQFPPPRQG